MTESSTSDPKYQLVAEVHEWAINKLTTGEPFQGLLLSTHPDGKKMSKYELATTEAALARCEAELSSELSDATSYAFVYDALLKQDDKLAYGSCLSYGEPRGCLGNSIHTALQT